MKPDEIGPDNAIYVLALTWAGVAQGLAAGYLDPLIGGSVSAVFPYLVMVAILFLRPSGLFGSAEVARLEARG